MSKREGVGGQQTQTPALLAGPDPRPRPEPEGGQGQAAGEAQAGQEGASVSGLHPALRGICFLG